MKKFFVLFAVLLIFAGCVNGYLPAEAGGEIAAEGVETNGDGIGSDAGGSDGVGLPEDAGSGEENGSPVGDAGLNENGGGLTGDGIGSNEADFGSEEACSSGVNIVMIMNDATMRGMFVPWHWGRDLVERLDARHGSVVEYSWTHGFFVAADWRYDREFSWVLNPSLPPAERTDDDRLLWGEGMLRVLGEISADTDVVIIDLPDDELAEFTAALRERHPDIFVIALICTLDGTPRNAEEASADLILEFDSAGAFQRFPSEAQNMGATAMVYFYDSFRGWDEDGNETWDAAESDRRRTMRELSRQTGLEFFTEDIAGAIQCGSSYAQYMSETQPRLIAEHGEDIVFFGLCNERIFWSWLMNGTIYLFEHSQWFEPTPCAIAESMIFPIPDLSDPVLLVEAITADLDERGNRGRLAGQAMPMRLLLPLAAAEYGMMRANDAASPDGIDLAALEKAFAHVLFEHTGRELGVTLTQNGNRVLVLPDYLVF